MQIAARRANLFALMEVARSVLAFLVDDDRHLGGAEQQDRQRRAASRRALPRRCWSARWCRRWRSSCCSAAAWRCAGRRRTIGGDRADACPAGVHLLADLGGPDAAGRGLRLAGCSSRAWSSGSRTIRAGCSRTPTSWRAAITSRTSATSATRRSRWPSDLRDYLSQDLIASRSFAEGPIPSRWSTANSTNRRSCRRAPDGKLRTAAIVDPEGNGEPRA